MNKIIKIIIICTLLMVSVLSLMSCGTGRMAPPKYNACCGFETQTAVIEDDFVKLKVYFGIQYVDLTFEEAQASDYGKIDTLRFSYYDEKDWDLQHELKTVECKLFSEEYKVDKNEKTLKQSVEFSIPIEAFVIVVNGRSSISIEADGYCGDELIEKGVIYFWVYSNMVDEELILSPSLNFKDTFIIISH